MIETQIKQDNVINFQEPTMSIVSERHRNIILTFRKEMYWLASIMVTIANKIDFNKPLGINNFRIEGSHNERIN
jgi:hypothetical protein